MVGGPEELGALVRAARERRGLTQAELCGKELSEPLLSAIERGKRVPSLAVLVQLYGRLAEPGTPVHDHHQTLAQWLAAWVVAQAAPRRSKRMDRLDQKLRGLLAESAARLARAVRRDTRTGRAPWSLAHLADFGPFVAICGDRREPQPKSLADLFILNPSVSDLTWLPTAPEGMVSSVRTDKLVVQLSEDSLRREFGDHNLLVIGAPNVNWAARMINPSALWRFKVDPGWEAWDRDLRQCSQLNQRSTLTAFSAVLGAVKTDGKRRDLVLDESRLPAQGELGERTLQTARELAAELLRGPDGMLHWPKEIMAKFVSGGVVDPIEGIDHDVASDQDTDFAIVSVAPHPWARSNDKVAVLVSGLGGPATAEALRMLLSEPSAFEHHPLGGVLEFQLPAYEDWASPFREPSWGWATAPYQLAELKGKVPAGADELVDRLLARANGSATAVAGDGRGSGAEDPGVPQVDVADLFQEGQHLVASGDVLP
jgi:transcriptional regulator with XRE-family HTH domain